MVKYLRLLTCDDAKKVVKFINENDSKDYANIVSGGVRMSVSPNNLHIVESFIKSICDKYEISDEPPYVTGEQIINNLKIHLKQLNGKLKNKRI